MAKSFANPGVLIKGFANPGILTKFVANRDVVTKGLRIQTFQLKVSAKPGVLQMVLESRRSDQRLANSGVLTQVL